MLSAILKGHKKKPNKFRAKVTQMIIRNITVNKIKKWTKYVEN